MSYHHLARQISSAVQNAMAYKKQHQQAIKAGGKLVGYVVAVVKQGTLNPKK
jgi:hypothetical protein